MRWKYDLIYMLLTVKVTERVLEASERHIQILKVEESLRNLTIQRGIHVICTIESHSNYRHHVKTRL